jgi:hypothetical protein
MAKVLVERPRLGSRYCRGPKKGYRREARYALTNENGGVRHEGIKVRGGHAKSFSEHLGPLRRFLDSQVGRPWNAIYSDICRHVDRGNVIQKHILTHLFQYVETDAVLIDGVPHYPPHRRWGSCRPILGRWTWYVCLRSGLLKRAPQSLPRLKQRKPLRHWISNTQFCEQQAGGWVLVTLEPLPEANESAFDSYLSRWVRKDASQTLASQYGKPYYALRVAPLTHAQVGQLPIPIDAIRPSVDGPSRR